MIFQRLATAAMFCVTVIGVAHAQIDLNFPVSQTGLLHQPPSDQSRILAEAILKAAPNRDGCSNPQASLRKTFQEGSGGWLVRCSDKNDFWVVVPTEAGKGAMVLSCPLMRVMMGRDCYTFH